MDKNVIPSTAMIEKLLKLNGELEKFEKILQEYPILIALPHILEKPKDITEFYSRRQLLESFQKVYAKHFTASEILDLIAFYKTPIGIKLAQKEDLVHYDLREAAVQFAIDMAVKIVRKQNDGKSS
jgi:hypothetical protein